MSQSNLSRQSIGNPAEEKSGRGTRVRRDKRHRKTKGHKTTKQSSLDSQRLKQQGWSQHGSAPDPLHIHYDIQFSILMELLSV